MDIASKIQNLMDEKGISAYKLAKETGVSYTGVTKILNGQTKAPQVDSLKAIADYFGKSVDYFTNSDENVDFNEDEEELDDGLSYIAREFKNLDSQQQDLVKVMIETMRRKKKNQEDK